MMKRKLIFGVFTRGKIVFILNTITCTEAQADFVVRLLDLGKDTLLPDHYFAYDYADRS